LAAKKHTSVLTKTQITDSNFVLTAALRNMTVCITTARNRLMNYINVKKMARYLANWSWKQIPATSLKI